ncbi:hypothetical protein C7H19_03035 [Aphanothece hegewaldii CCALA 016]|uniref:Uncharacterized protein n=1 Tax=Aphanothece hegewaldii CCALA 016 TaxID=2107694 RepID=A0A2T1M2T6_9CHRO|nr:hypothetical protein [Aphanothece hegewaldii]PSF39042.1 hypothetical protein C7H19_03035 [Aphanothece hegewaldii CCALA 016]
METLTVLIGDIPKGTYQLLTANGYEMLLKTKEKVYKGLTGNSNYKIYELALDLRNELKSVLYHTLKSDSNEVVAGGLLGGLAGGLLFGETGAIIGTVVGASAGASVVTINLELEFFDGRRCLITTSPAGGYILQKIVENYSNPDKIEEGLFIVEAELEIYEQHQLNAQKNSDVGMMGCGCGCAVIILLIMVLSASATVITHQQIFPGENIEINNRFKGN